MATVSVRIPGLLTRFTDGRGTVSVDAETVDSSVLELLKTYPALEPHLLDDRGRLREHLVLFHNGSTVDGGLVGGDVEVVDGDEVVVLQAVSGG